MRRLTFPYIVAVLASVVACSETTPTEPSRLVTPEGSGSVTALTCSADLDGFVDETGSAIVTFSLPTFAGQTVSKSVCTPSSGSRFALGTTPVTCSVPAAGDLSSSCSFFVQVVNRRLRKTRFLAFGDSITNGRVSAPVPTIVSGGLPESYPSQLEAILSTRYPTQTITIINEGQGGELSFQGRQRLPGELSRHDPDVLLLLEGINQLLLIGPAQVANDLEAMANTALSRGVSVVIATLTPIGDPKENNRPGTRDAIDNLNGKIQSIASRLNLGFVDLHREMRRTPGLIGRDGLHPTEEGYRFMAGLFADEIIDLWEEVETPSAASSSFTSLLSQPGVDGDGVLQ